MKGKVLVAGATGAIGQPLCRLLIQDGWQVTGTTRSIKKAAVLRELGVTPVIVDVFDAAELRAALIDARPDIVVHQLSDLPPGLDPARMAEGRARTARLREVGTRNLVTAAVAAGAERIVAQSICFAYAPGPVPHGEDAPLHTDAPGELGVTFRAVAELEKQVMEAPLEAVILRYGKLYGPGTGFDRPPPEVPLHVDSAANAARLALTRGAGIYNIAEDDSTVSTRRATAELGWLPSVRPE